jgi:AcrR family transcriptional regulator
MKPKNQNVDETSTPAPTLRLRKKEATRLALISASQKFFATKGYNGTTLQDIADEVGVSTQTLLRYFESKAHLRIAIVADRTEMIADALIHRKSSALEVWKEVVTLQTQSLIDPPDITMANYVAGVRQDRQGLEPDPVLEGLDGAQKWRIIVELSYAIAGDLDLPSTNQHTSAFVGALVGGRNAINNQWYDGEITDNEFLDAHLHFIEDCSKRFGVN